MFYYLKNDAFSSLFPDFERKVTKNFLYLHVISVLIKVKSEKRKVKIELCQGLMPNIVKRR